MPESNFGGSIGEQIGVGTGTVTSVSVATANGFSGSVANPTTTPAITLDITAEKLLATATGIDLNAAAATTLYTVPGGKTLYVTRVVLFNASAAWTTASISFGFTSAAFNDVIADAVYAELTGATLYTIVGAKVGAKRGAATNTFKVIVNTPEGGALTADIMVFGKLV